MGPEIKALRALQKQLPEWKTQIDGGLLAVGTESEPRLVTIARDGEGTFLLEESSGWHSHELEPSQAVGLARLLFSGCARVATQYRGAERVAMWLEHRLDGQLERETFVIFANPFDVDEWSTPVEGWRITHRYIKLIDSTSTEAFPEIRDAPFGVREIEANSAGPWLPDDWMRTLLTDKMGECPKGWRWASTSGNAFALAVPNGWRFNPLIRVSDATTASSVKATMPVSGSTCGFLLLRPLILDPALSSRQPRSRRWRLKSYKP